MTTTITGETLTERLTRTGEAILDLAAALPPDLPAVTVLGYGYPFTGRPDVVLHADGFDAGLKAVESLGGVFQHIVSKHDPGARQVHHTWTGTFQGWTVHVVAFWEQPAAAANEPADAAPGGDS